MSSRRDVQKKCVFSLRTIRDWGGGCVSRGRFSEAAVRWGELTQGSVYHEGLHVVQLPLFHTSVASFCSEISGLRGSEPGNII